jgi:hypothetical protein
MSNNYRGTNYKYGIEVGDKAIYQNVVLAKALQVYSIALSPAQVAANTTVEQTFTVLGLGASDVPLDIIKPTCQAGLGLVGYRVVGTNTLAIWFANTTVAAITPTPGEIYTVPVLALT